MSAIDELNDNCFVITSDFFVEVCQEIEDAVGRKPTLDELCELLTWGLRSISSDILHDIDIGDVLQITATRRKHRVKRLAVGDVVAVPAGNGQWYLGVYLTTNRFGDAFGFFRGTWPLRPFQPEDTPEPLLPVVYSGNDAIKDGRWKVIGNDPQLLACFPAKPEIYHMKKYHLDDDLIGPFGSAENDDDELRAIDEDEARAVGLLDDSYQTGWLEERVPVCLETMNRRWEALHKG